MNDHLMTFSRVRTVTEISQTLRGCDHKVSWYTCLVWWNRSIIIKGIIYFPLLIPTSYILLTFPHIFLLQSRQMYFRNSFTFKCVIILIENVRVFVITTTFCTAHAEEKRYRNRLVKKRRGNTQSKHKIVYYIHILYT